MIEDVGGAVVVTGTDIKFFQLLVWKSVLKLEIHGMKRRGRSVYSIVKSELGFKGSKQSVLTQLEAHIKTKEAQRAEG